MNYTVYFTDDSRADMNQIADYIAQDNPVLAITFVDELEKRVVDTFSVLPHSGRIYKGVTRFFPLDNRVVFYEVDDSKKAVYILHIVGGATDWKKR